MKRRPATLLLPLSAAAGFSPPPSPSSSRCSRGCCAPSPASRPGAPPPPPPPAPGPPPRPSRRRLLLLRAARPGAAALFAAASSSANASPAVLPHSPVVIIAARRAPFAGAGALLVALQAVRGRSATARQTTEETTRRLDTHSQGRRGGPGDSNGAAAPRLRRVGLLLGLPLPPWPPLRRGERRPDLPLDRRLPPRCGRRPGGSG